MANQREKGKLFVFSAPSGAGKTSMVKALLKRVPGLSFSVSATSRPKRPDETNGVDYYFMSRRQFRQKIEKGAFLEWEEVYPGSFYGTLLAEVERIREAGKHVAFDVDVAGGMRIKQHFREQCLALFIMPPSLEELRKRLLGRQTESEESLSKRIGKAEQELQFAGEFDLIIVNDILDQAISEAEKAMNAFISGLEPA